MPPHEGTRVSTTSGSSVRAGGVLTGPMAHRAGTNGSRAGSGGLVDWWPELISNGCGE